jgi:hypothetical protein
MVDTGWATLPTWRTPYDDVVDPVDAGGKRAPFVFAGSGAPSYAAAATPETAPTPSYSVAAAPSYVVAAAPSYGTAAREGYRASGGGGVEAPEYPSAAAKAEAEEDVIVVEAAKEKKKKEKEKGKAGAEEQQKARADVFLRMRAAMDARLERCMDTFRRLDTSGNGRLSARELRVGLGELGFAPTERDLALVVAALDCDGSGGVSYRELARELKDAADGEQTEVLVGDAVC